MTMPTYSTLPVAAEVRPAESLAELAAMIVADAELLRSPTGTNCRLPCAWACGWTRQGRSARRNDVPS